MVRKINRRIFLFILVTLLIGLVVLVINEKKSITPYETQNPPTTINNTKQTEKPITTPSSKKGSVTYTNSAYGYQIDVPDGSMLINEDYNTNVNYYTRIQNYSTKKNTPGLAEKEYYLEVYTKEGIVDCNKGGYKNPTEFELNGSIGYKGFLERGGGESAEIRYALCINHNSDNFYIQASEDFESIAQKIVDSFRFTD